MMRKFKSKILTPGRLKTAVERLRRKKKKIVFTNGCFDLLHPGHVTYLEKARAKGDFLIVALDTDQSVRLLKGLTRPVNPLPARMQVVAALESVDAVTFFEEGNPLPLILKLRPDVLVKGGDWKISDIIGSREVLSWSGKVYSIQFVDGYSTTNIIKKIK